MQSWLIQLLHTPKRRKIVTFALLSTFSLTILVFIAATKVPSPDESAIKNVCFSALVADQTLGVPHTAGMTTLKSDSIVTTDSGVITDAVVQEMVARVGSEYPKYYSGSMLQNKIQIMQNSILGSTGSSVRHLAGGVQNMSFSTINITGTIATVEAQATVWVTVAQDQGNGHLVPATPHNTLNIKYSLSKIGGLWLITNQTWKFAPGSEP